jgi:hypothetical protein
MVPVLDDRLLAAVPCSHAKIPLTPHGWLDATDDPDLFTRLMAAYSGPLVGAATREFSVIDVDPRNGGDVWLTAVRDRLPETRVHRTRSGGWHLLFRACPSVRSSVGRIAPGVDVRAGPGSGIVWWPFEGLPWHEARLAEWPHDLLGGLQKSDLERENAPLVTAATEGAFSSPSKTLNVQRRSHSLVRVVETAPPGARNDRLFWAACRFGEMLAEGAIALEVAAQLLANAAGVCGLVRDDGAAAVLATIRSGLWAGMARPYRDLDIEDEGEPSPCLGRQEVPRK